MGKGMDLQDSHGKLGKEKRSSFVPRNEGKFLASFVAILIPGKVASEW